MHSRFVADRVESAGAGCGVDVHGRMEIMYRHEEEKETSKKWKKNSNLWVITAERGMLTMGNGNRAMEQESRRKKISRRYEPKVMGNKQSQILGIRDHRDCGPGRCLSVCLSVEMRRDDKK